MPRGMSRLTSGRASRLSATGTCSSGTRYSPGSWPWNRSDDSGPGAPDRVGRVRHRSLRLIDLEGEVNPPLQIEAEVDGDAPHGRVFHAAGRGIAHPLRGVRRDQRPNAQDQEDADRDEA